MTDRTFLYSIVTANNSHNTYYLSKTNKLFSLSFVL
ncbi:unnamed protein product [Brassica oleracea var. botrytis]|uniref:(rape) hypothetical protein n=1 Tax=Brassica napus TaxID=3708 RepID=A0A816U8P1_BRANA|nr:unnamed protein product [Brassica napus]